MQTRNKHLEVFLVLNNFTIRHFTHKNIIHCTWINWIQQISSVGNALKFLFKISRSFSLVQTTYNKFSLHLLQCSGCPFIRDSFPSDFPFRKKKKKINIDLFFAACFVESYYPCQKLRVTQTWYGVKGRGCKREKATCVLLRRNREKPEAVRCVEALAHTFIWWVARQ